MVPQTPMAREEKKEEKYTPISQVLNMWDVPLWMILDYFERHTGCKVYDGEHPFSFAFYIMDHNMLLCIYEQDIILKHLIFDEKNSKYELWISVMRIPIDFVAGCISSMHSNIKKYVNNHNKPKENKQDNDTKGETGTKEKGAEAKTQEK